ncbi:MAG: hypothetical protein U1D30_17195 [Planctomycetota bacterium]
MFLDPISNEVLDFVGGRQDLEKRVLRAIGEPQRRFAEDKLRLLRAARFASTLGFEIDPATEQAALSMADQIVVVSPERIKAELENMFTASTRRDALRQLRNLGLFSPLFPELADRLSEKSLWSFTEKVFELLGNRTTFPSSIAGLLASWPEDSASALAEALCLRLRCSNEERQRAVWLVSRRTDLDHARGRSLAFLKRLWAHPDSMELLRYVESISRASGGNADDVEYCRSILGNLTDEEIAPTPLINGNDLIASGLKPGPRFQSLLEQIRDAQLNGEIRSRDEAIVLLKKFADSP